MNAEIKEGEIRLSISTNRPTGGELRISSPPHKPPLLLQAVTA